MGSAIIGDDIRVTTAFGLDDPCDTSALWEVAYDELRQLARRRIGRERPGQTLQPTALVNEVYLRLASERRWDGRGHFLAAAANAMRHIMIDRARRHGALKRGGALERESLTRLAAGESDPGVEALDITFALRKLEAIDREKSALVTLRYLLGCTIEETARALGMSPAKVKKDWTFVRAWLRRELRSD
jgi:RNA polymerase sigma factor (TIGR02999 family)